MNLSLQKADYYEMDWNDLGAGRTLLLVAQNEASGGPVLVQEEYSSW
jgi:hypothetical protein